MDIKLEWYYFGKNSLPRSVHRPLLILGEPIYDRSLPWQPHFHCTDNIRHTNCSTKFTTYVVFSICIVYTRLKDTTAGNCHRLIKKTY